MSIAILQCHFPGENCCLQLKLRRAFTVNTKQHPLCTTSTHNLNFAKHKLYNYTIILYIQSVIYDSYMQCFHCWPLKWDLLLPLQWPQTYCPNTKYTASLYKLTLTFCMFSLKVFIRSSHVTKKMLLKSNRYESSHPSIHTSYENSLEEKFSLL